MKEQDMRHDGTLGFEVSFLIRSVSDTSRLLAVLRDYFYATGAEVEGFPPDVIDHHVNELEQLIALWDDVKPVGWLNRVLDELSEFENILKEPINEHEFSHRAQSVIEALGFAAKRLQGIEAGDCPYTVTSPLGLSSHRPEPL